VTDKSGEQINVGDTVSSKSRGGKHTGVVTDIMETLEDAKEGPSKVLFEDQHDAYHPKYGVEEELIQKSCLGHPVSHNLRTLVHGDNPF